MEQPTSDCLKSIFYKAAPLTDWLVKAGLFLNLSDFQRREENLSKTISYTVQTTPVPTIAASITTLRSCAQAVWEIGVKADAFLLGFTEKRERLSENTIGLLNFPNVLTFTEIIERALISLGERKWRGPFLVICSTERLWDNLHLLGHERVRDVIAHPLLSYKQEIILQATPDVIRVIIGDSLRIVEDDKGERVECQIGYQLRADFSGNCGIAVRQNTPPRKTI